MQQTTPTGDAVSPLLLATVGEQCPNCAAPMAADQRYCTECGERRGRPRLPFMDGRPRPAASSTPIAAPVRARRVRATSSTALIAGVFTLLLAMGVGVLIGASGDDRQAASSAPAVQVVSVPGAAAAPAGATAATMTPGDAGAASGTKAAAPSSSTSGSSPAAKKRSGSGSGAALAAKKVKTPPAVKVGDKCTGGKGCTNGTFTGDFFGG